MSWDVVSSDTSEFARECALARMQLRGLSYKDAIREALFQLMEKDERVFILGQGVDSYTWVYGTTKGLVERFGKARVMDMPIAEETMTGIAMGTALVDMRPIVVHMRNDFLLPSMNQIINHAAKWCYMFGGSISVPLVIRAIIGRGWGSAAQHSQSLQALFMHVPGLKIVMPSTAYDAKGLFIASLKDRNPVMFIETRFLYDHVSYVPEEMFEVPIGKACVRRQGQDVTIVALSYLVFEAIRASDELKEEGISAEVIDPRSLKPLDEETIFQSVSKTGRLVVADSGWQTCGVGAEISARVTSEIFDALKAPILRVSSLDVPTPASPSLEKLFYPGKDEIINAVKKYL